MPQRVAPEAHRHAFGGTEASAGRLALALVVSACGHAAVLANATFTPGIAEIALFAPNRPLSARLAPAPAPQAAARSAEREERPAKAAGLRSAEIYYRGSEVDERAVPLNLVDFEYPESALAANVSGTVTLRLLIDHEGVLRDASVVGSRPAGIFENAALQAVLSLRFRPAIRNGAPVGSIKIIEVPFDPDCKRTGSCVN